MKLFKSKNHAEEIRIPRARFLQEQDGPTECELKKRIAECLSCNDSVRHAYLARARYADDSCNVALCLRTELGPDRKLVEEIGKIFASLFASHEHLDIMFLSEAQEAEVMAVCKPFFTS